MTRYLYIVRTKRTFDEVDIEGVKTEICKLFDCTEVKVSGATDFLAYTPIAPEETEQALRELSARFGGEFRGGVKMD
jgi:hypothetical protein